MSLDVLDGEGTTCGAGLFFSPSKTSKDISEGHLR